MAQQFPTEIGALAKKISDFQINGEQDFRLMVEMCRVLAVEVSVVHGYAQYEMQMALRMAEGGKSARRAKQVTRPMQQAVTLDLLAARRITTTYATFVKVFADQISAARRPKGRARKWDWEQSTARNGGGAPQVGSTRTTPAPRESRANANAG